MTNLSVIGIFLEGLLSFISPCVLPLIPIYMSYLTAKAKEEINGEIKYNSFKVIMMTICFILGISLTFFILGLSLGILKEFISEYNILISLFGGIILILFSLSGFGIININFLNRDYRINSKIELSSLNYIKAFIFGFVFSFSWTPCIGPMLTNVILLASKSDAFLGNIYILVYTLGFIIPFLLLGLFYKKGLDYIAKNKKTLINISKLASIIILLFGMTMIYDASKEIIIINKSYKEVLVNNNSNTKKETNDSDVIKMYDFEIVDQFSNVHKLSDYNDKYIVINFIASWCTYCKKEIPSYQEFANEVLDDVVVLYVMNDDINTSNGGIDIDTFIKEENIDIPVLKDDGTLFRYLGISSFPTMAFIGPDGNVIGVQSGMLNIEQMNEILDIAKKIHEERS